MLELKDVRFSVEDDNGSKKDIINGISLTIDESKFVAITGPNGSGKSTLAKLIVGIISQHQEKYYITEKILLICRFPTGQSLVSVLHFSSL